MKYLRVGSSCTFGKPESDIVCTQSITWKLAIAFFALVGPGNITPIFMGAVTAFSKIGHSLVNLSLPSQPNSRSIGAMTWELRTAGAAGVYVRGD